MKKDRKLLSRDSYGYLFIMPFFIVFIIFILYPIIYTMFLSFNSWDGLSQIKYKGMQNYLALMKDEVFLLSLKNTARMWIMNFIPQILFALVLSAIFTFNKVKGMKFFRAAYYLPNLITAASVGLLFNLLFNGDKSVVNYILVSLNVNGAPFKFFNNEMFTSGLVSYIQWWMWFGYTTVIVMAGISTIDSSLYDAAMVDGAGKTKTYIHITLPLILPTLVYIAITSLIGGMQLFDVPATLTNGTGDPRKSILTTSMYIYLQGFKYHNYGYAAAVSVGLFLIISVLSVVALKVMSKKGDEVK